MGVRFDPTLQSSYPLASSFEARKSRNIAVVIFALTGGFPFNLRAMIKTLSLLIAAALLMGAPLAYPQDKETDQQLKQATEAAKKMGLKMPDLKELNEENEKDEAKQKTAARAAVESKGPATLPDWTPKVPQFTPSGPATRKLVEGQPNIVLTGTSPLTPEALADAWDKFQNPKFGHERGGSKMNDDVDLYVSYQKNDDGTEVKMEAERKPGAKITQVTISSPIPVPASSDDDN
jgi:hypothetical protein